MEQERGVGSPVILPMSTTGNRKEFMNGLVCHGHGQSRVSGLQQRSQEGGKRQVKTLIVARKPVQEKTCTNLGLHLPVPPNCGNPR